MGSCSLMKDSAVNQNETKQNMYLINKAISAILFKTFKYPR